MLQNLLIKAQQKGMKIICMDVYLHYMFAPNREVDLVDWQNHFGSENLNQLHLLLEEVRCSSYSYLPLLIV